MPNALTDADKQALRRLGLNIRHGRVEAGTSQEQLALESGVARSHIGALERGERNPSVLALLRIGTALGVPPGDLLKDM
jgi:transcriptional regulator with XRE-family HTH domain